MKIFIAILFLISLCISDEIKAIKYDGLIRMSNLIANEVSGLKVGDKLDSKKINQAIIAFYKQDYFNDVYASFDNGVLTFSFVEKPGISNIEIKGFGNEQETEEITKQINIKKGDTYDIYKEKHAKEVIINALEEKGLYGSVVEVDTAKIEDSISLTFNVNKGENIIIRKSYYEGSTLDKSDIEAFSANRERHSWLGWLPWWPSGELKLKELEYDNLRIQDVYMQKGYLDANVSTPLLNANFSNYDATLLYKINEGERYKVSQIIIKKNDDIENLFKEEDIKNLLKIEIGEFFNVQTLRQDVESIKSYIMDKGYAFVVVSPDLNKNVENREVAITYNINIGKKVHINDIIITGNTTSSDRIIRREMIIAPGDIYNITNIRKSENALRRSGFFDKVNISEIRIDETSMNLLVEVVEGRTGEIMAGIGYGSYDKLMINGSIRERNLFGTGVGVQLQVNWSKYNQLYNIGLSNPRILDSEYSGSINVFRSYFDNYDYIENSTGFNIGVGRNLTDELSINLTYGLAKSKLYDYKDVLYSGLYPRNGILKSTLTPGIYFDNTDDYYFPKNGAILQATSEFAGLGGNAKYIKLYGKAGFYYHLKNLVDFDLILRYKAQIGAIFDIGYIPFTETFYMGGIGTVRGFRTYSISPRNDKNLRVGGNYMFTNSVEISYGIIEAINMRVAMFFDFGMLGVRNFNDSDLSRMSWGFALEWVSPIGPLVFVFPIAIKPKSYDDVSRFEFTMGTRF
ncbi:outer membrane protein assembly factor BamA [Helicobacter sp. MIT 14-3879]|uniref:outer membrane protein assembly factor BamA n=1 Tax=Helicobacter sp. MIT 14-3879 TaxID=2040649 RepID=UPI00216291CF|nr:outer membrane protein assembly factor BamA [Helicobacter sp. MIT 14-3879]